MFGSLATFGYEESWVEEVSGLRLDVFSTERAGAGERVGAMWVEGRAFPCVARVGAVVRYTWWDRQVGGGGGWGWT